MSRPGSARESSIRRSALLAAVVTVVASSPAAHAQMQAPPPAVSVTPPAVVQPLPVAQPLPRLTAAQAEKLTKLLEKDTVAQGLAEQPPTLPPAGDDGALVRSALDHARAVHAGRLAEADFQRVWAMRPPAYDPLPTFREAVERDRLSGWIASLPPPYAGYDALVAGLARYRRIAADGGWPSLATTPALVFGAQGPAVAALRQRLALEDPKVKAGGTRFDADLLDAVRRAQRRYGLNPAGTVGAQTIAALNVPVAARIRQIMANMERWRWLPPTLEKDRVQVNIAAAVLTVFDGDQPVMSMKAVTGRPGDETPMLTSAIHSIVLNPPWNVPAGIATRELWPKGPAWLKRNGFRVIATGDGGKRLQQASERSALGRYKFDFANPFAVYLHDTPAQAGFARFDRLASHGCVRLERPDDLAQQLMKDTPEWPPETIAATVAAGKTVRAALNQPVAVYLLYWTAFASADSQVGFRDDPYHWDDTLATRIAARSASQATATF